MHYRQVRDILEWIQSLHQHLAQCYRQLADQSKNERVTLMLQYLADHEAALQDALQKYEADASESTLDTWMDGAQLELPPALANLKIDLQNASPMDLVKIAINSHDFLIGKYKELHELAEVETVREIFANLLQLEQHESMRTVRDAFRLEDY